LLGKSSHIVAAFEGLDRTGKSTLSKALASRLPEYEWVHLPSDEVREQILNATETPYIYPIQEMESLCRTGNKYILDRYFGSTFAYQMQMGCSWEEIDSAINNHHIIAPDTFVFVDAPDDILEGRRPPENRFETMSKAGLRDGYYRFFEAADAYCNNIMYIDGSLPLAQCISDTLDGFELDERHTLVLDIDGVVSDYYGAAFELGIVKVPEPEQYECITWQEVRYGFALELIEKSKPYQAFLNYWPSLVTKYAPNIMFMSARPEYTRWRTVRWIKDNLGLLDPNVVLVDDPKVKINMLKDISPFPVFVDDRQDTWMQAQKAGIFSFCPSRSWNHSELSENDVWDAVLSIA